MAFLDSKAPDSMDEDVSTGSCLEIELTLVSWKKVEEISDDGLIVKKTLKSAEGWDKPKEGATVKIRCTGRLTDGTIFEEHGEGNELTVVLDEGIVLYTLSFPNLDSS